MLINLKLAFCFSQNIILCEGYLSNFEMWVLEVIVLAWKINWFQFSFVLFLNLYTSPLPFPISLLSQLRTEFQNLRFNVCWCACMHACMNFKINLSVRCTNISILWIFQPWLSIASKHLIWLLLVKYWTFRNNFPTFNGWIVEQCTRGVDSWQNYLARCQPWKTMGKVGEHMKVCVWRGMCLGGPCRCITPMCLGWCRSLVQLPIKHEVPAWNSGPSTNFHTSILYQQLRLKKKKG